MKPALTPKPRRLSLRQRWQRVLPHLSDAEFVALIAESRRLMASHPELPILRRCFLALAVVRGRQRVAAEAA